MSGFATAGTRAALRARRWDVIVLGSALPGLVAAARLGMQRLRVLIIEERAAAAIPEIEREPFSLGGPAGVLDACLRDLTVPLIDRRRLQRTAIAHQVVFPEARIDVGDAALTAEELVVWGLADAASATALVRELERASQAELEALLSAPVVRATGLRGLVRGPSARQPRERGLPDIVAHPTPELAPFLAAQVRGLAGLGAGRRPSPEARARLLGACLGGGGLSLGGHETLRGLLRRRIRAVHGEWRELARGFELVTVGSQPGIAIDVTGEIWLGRALLVNAPAGALAASLRDAGKPVPDCLDVPPPVARRECVRFGLPRGAVPEGMAPHVIHAGDPKALPDGGCVATLRLFPGPRGDAVELVASTVRPAAAGEADAVADALAGVVASLLPFSEGSPPSARSPAPSWDDDAWLADCELEAGWPGEVEIRASARPPVYRLSREALGGLGVEGELLLGWRAGDAIQADLA